MNKNKIFNYENVVAYIQSRLPGEKLPLNEDLAGRLKTICENINRNNELNRAGQKILIRQIADNVINNFLIRKEVYENPGINEVNISKPIFIAGLPRTGTTFLHKLMALDKDNRILRLQEGLKPAVVANTKKADRQKYAESWISTMSETIKETRQMIDISLETPAECCFLKRNDLRCHSISYQVKLAPLEEDWFEHTNLAECYAFYKLQLKLIQYHSFAKRWLLKCPSHFPAIEHIYANFPDAALVCTHRDMDEVIASFTSLISTIRSSLARAFSKEAIAAELMEGLQAQTWIHYEYRKYNPGSNIIDISYSDLTKDPIGCVHEIYRRNRIPYSLRFEKRMSEWLKINQRNKYGEHIYNLSMFGLTTEIIRNLFSDPWKSCDTRKFQKN